MERLTFEIIKNQIIGQSSGHMAAIPNNPLLFSMIEQYGILEGYGNQDDSFKVFILELAEFIADKKDK